MRGKGSGFGFRVSSFVFSVQCPYGFRASSIMFSVRTGFGVRVSFVVLSVHTGFGVRVCLCRRAGLRAGRRPPPPVGCLGFRVGRLGLGLGVRGLGWRV